MSEEKVKRLVIWLKEIGYFHLASQIEKDSSKLQKALRTPRPSLTTTK